MGGNAEAIDIFIMYITSFELFWESLHQILISVYNRTQRSHYFWKTNILF